MNLHLEMTMTTREVAKLTGKRHGNVVRDTEKVFTELKLESSEYLDTYQDSTGRTLKQYRLDKDLTMTLITGYDIVRCHAVNRRWRESHTLKTSVKAVKHFIVKLIVRQGGSCTHITYN